VALDLRTVEAVDPQVVVTADLLPALVELNAPRSTDSKPIMW